MRIHSLFNTATQIPTYNYIHSSQTTHATTSAHRLAQKIQANVPQNMIIQDEWQLPEQPHPF